MQLTNKKYQLKYHYKLTLNHYAVLPLQDDCNTKQGVGAAATIYPRPGLQWNRAAAALSQAGPDQPIRAIPVGRPHTPTGCTRQTSDRQMSDSIIA